MTLDLITPGQPITRDVAFASGEHTLSGTLYHPQDTPDRIVIINPATGVSAKFYRAFANWVAIAQNAVVLTYDYRDFGASAKRPVRQSRATMNDWGVHDQQAARDYAAAEFPDLPVWIVGHSLGALCLAFQRNLDRIERVIAVGSGPVHVSDHPWPYRALALAFWYGPATLAALASGFLPGRRLRLGPDLPAGVYWQWRRWCTRRDFFASDIGTALPFPDWAGLKADMKVVAIADDDLLPPPAVWRLMRFYPEARKTQLTLRPSDYGLGQLGHIRVFAPESQPVWSALFAEPRLSLNAENAGRRRP